ncbi:MAG: hypothetical protein P8X63_06370 [Desulfuromonadaceae bacterium]
MIRRNFLGLDLSGGCLRGVVLRRQRNQAAMLCGAGSVSLAAGWSPTLRTENILDRAGFIAAVKELLDPLAGGEDRLALSLPDSIGRFVLTEVDTLLKSREEEIEVIKWQLKKALPAEAKDVQLDFQVLEKSESGRYRLAVSLLLRPVLRQYEEVLAEAGYHAVIVDFHALNLYNFYRSRLDLGEDFVLVGVDGGLLGLQFFQNRIPCFHRHKRISHDPQEIFDEINLSFATLGARYPGYNRAAVFLHTDWTEVAGLLEALRAAFEREVLVLDGKVDRFALKPEALGGVNGQSLVAAVGAAERLM